MADQQLGRQWIEERVRAQASDCGITLESVAWVTTTDDLLPTPQTVTLMLELRGHRVLETFFLADLEDLHSHDDLQVELGERIQRIVEGFARR